MAQSTPTMFVRGDRPDLASPLTQGTNKELTDTNNIDPNMIRKPDYWVYVYTVSDRAFDVSRPALNISKLKIGKSPESMQDKQSYALVWKVPSPYPLPYSDQVSGEIKLNTVHAERIAMDICNPNQKSTDMDAYIAPESVIGAGDDLIAKGLFFVHERDCTFAKDDTERKNPIPPKEAVHKAVARKEKYYNDLLDRAKGLEYSNQRMLDDFIASEPDVHLACEYFGVETKFHQVRTQKAVPVECPVCGSDMKRGAAFHPLPGSKLGVCVNDWARAIEAGVVSEEDRPSKKKKQPEVTA